MSDTKFSLQGIIIWLISVLFYLYEFLLRTLVGTFQAPIMSDLHLSTLQFTLISSSAYLFVYGLMQIPIGALISRYGFKQSILFAALVCTLSTFGFSYSTHFITGLIFRALMGFGSAFGFIGVLVCVYTWMPRKNLALFIGLSQFLGTLGPMLGGGPLNELAHSGVMSWQHFFLLMSATGLGLCTLILVFIKKKTNNDAPFIILEKPTQLKEVLISITRQKQFWIISLYCALIYFSLEYLSENECKNLLDTKGLSSVFASYMITLAWLGFALGSPLFGYYSDRINLRKPILIISSIVTFVSLFSIIYLPLTELSAIISFFSFGFGVGSASVSIALMSEQFKTNQVSSGLGINNAVTMLSISIIAPIISFILSSTTHQLTHSLADYQKVFSLLVLMPLVSLFLALFKIKETFGKSSKEPIILTLNKHINS